MGYRSRYGENLPMVDASKEYDYDYPEGLNFKPGSELHQEMLNRILDYAADSREAISPRFDSWNKIDHHLTGYVPRTEDETILKMQDSRKPVSVVVPISYAIREALLTNLSAVFFQDMLFPYEGVGPEDTVGAILFQHLIQQQVMRSGMELDLNTQWADGLSYGLGVLVPRWTREYSPTAEVLSMAAMEDGGYGIVEEAGEAYSYRRMVWEGNSTETIEPYRYLPDPNVPAHKVQKSRYVGWLSTESYYDLLAREYDGEEGLFNVKYVRTTRGRSFLSDEMSARGDREGLYRDDRQDTDLVDVIWMYVTLIPSEFGLGSGDYPEKWVFGIANDAVIVKANRIGLSHNQYPITVCCPDYDGYSIAPLSRLEVVYGLQETVDWLLSSRIANLRKTINGVFIIDPFMVNEEDVKRRMSQPGGYFRTRRQNWGRGVENAIKQLEIRDVTANTVMDINYMIGIIERVGGANATFQGAFTEDAPERRTKAEFEGVTRNASARLGHTGRKINIQCVRPLGFMLASHTQQFMSQEAYVKLTGDWPMVLAKEYGLDVMQDRIRVRPEDLDIRYDIAPIETKLPASQDGQMMLQLYQTALQNPLLSQRFDLVRMYKSIARRFGERNIDSFEIQVTAMPDQQLLNEAASGNMVPLGGPAV